MANKLLRHTPFRDLLPESIANDEFMVAAAEAVDEELAAIYDMIPSVSIMPNLENTVEPLLGTLAWEKHIDGAEGFELVETDEQKRELIATSIEAHRHKGTRWAMERIAEILGMRIRIVEWWETDPPGEPYTFRLEFIEVTRPIGPELYVQLNRLVMELKNVRSYLAGMAVYLTTRGHAFIAFALLCGQSVTVFPLQNNEVTVSSAAPYLAAAMQYVNRVTVYPSEE